MPNPARVSPARSAAFEVLLRVETRRAHAVELLHSNLLTRLSPADRALTTELVMGVLRWRQKLDQAVEEAGGRSIAGFDPEVQLALRLGAYQLIHLGRIPARAAVHESVELVKKCGKRSASSLVNALLRRLCANLGTNLPATRIELAAVELANLCSHPVWLVERWTKIYGSEVAQKICQYDQQRPHTTIRLKSPALREELVGEGLELEPASLVSHAWHVVTGDVTKTQAYAQRRLAVQDEGSQMVALLAKGKEILDCCAAPGGKCAIAAEHNPKALVVAMDLHAHRVRLMQQLIGSRALVVAADARRPPFTCGFDCIIADLPCTGTGTLARNPEIKWRLAPEDLERLAVLQLEILDSIAAHLAPQGMLVYSTCSLESEEGEEIVGRFVAQKHPKFRIVPVRSRLEELVSEGVLTPSGLDRLCQGEFLRTLPGVHPCDGFFAALLQRWE